jgi:hypothetical protein
MDRFAEPVIGAHSRARWPAMAGVFISNLLG